MSDEMKRVMLERQRAIVEQPKLTDAERIKYLMDDVKDLEQRLHEAQMTIKALRTALSDEMQKLIKESFNEGTK